MQPGGIDMPLQEYVHNGTRWWDYTGYFLNLHGRICAEGLLVFGIGGMAIVCRPEAESLCATSFPPS